MSMTPPAAVDMMTALSMSRMEWITLETKLLC